MKKTITYDVMFVRRTVIYIWVRCSFKSSVKKDEFGIKVA